MVGNFVSLAVSIETMRVWAQTTHQRRSGRTAHRPLHVVTIESCRRLGEAIQIRRESFASIAAQDRAQIVDSDKEDIVLPAL